MQQRVCQNVFIQTLAKIKNKIFFVLGCHGL